MLVHEKNKLLIEVLRTGMRDATQQEVRKVLNRVCSSECVVHFTHPFEDMRGPGELYDTVYAGLINAIPDLERRDFLVMAGPSADATNWVGCAGHYVGVMERPWLDIPPTFHMVYMRFHEFYRIEDDCVVEIQAVWDIPQLMMQAHAWPMCPSLGVELMAPSPASQDGLHRASRDSDASEASLQLVSDMLSGLQRHAEHGPQAMGLEQYWHPRMTWYGPAGIGTNRRISGFRNWHQIPFLKALPDRGMNPDVPHYFFSENAYVAYTGWSGMRCTVSGDGWLGIAPSGKEIQMRSLDFWRTEEGLLRENWVLVDLLHVWRQLGVDVCSRMRELTAARQASRPVNLNWH